MYARVLSIQGHPSQFAEGIQAYLDSIVPATRQEKGFTAGYLMTDRFTGEVMSISLWATEQDMLASEDSGYLQTQLAKLERFATEAPVVKHFEVSVQT